MKIETIPHESEPWLVIGRFFCDRAVIKELGGPIFSSDGSVWLVARERSKVVGFCALRETPKAIWYDYVFVVPERRGKEVFRRLAEARDRYARSLPARPLKVAVREERWPHYEERGWTVASRRGSWVYGTKEAA